MADDVVKRNQVVDDEDAGEGDVSFKGYDKIGESSAAWTPTDLEWKKIKQTKWCVQEKIHGANFCFIVRPNDAVEVANRRAVLAPGDSFFNHESVVTRLQERVIVVAKLVRQFESRAQSIYIFGELFGGQYPHPEVRAVPGVQGVQTGIWYSPQIEFCAFDIAIDVQLDADAPTRTYLDVEKALEFFKSASLFCTDALFVGKFEAALEYNIEFESTIPKKLGLPPIQKNKAEGVVIKPLRNISVTTKKGLVRAVVKNKIAEFKEVRRFHGATKWNDTNSGQKGSNANNGISSLDMLTWEMQALVTEQRLHNALSKVGFVDKDDKVKLKQLFDMYIADVEESLQENCEEQLKTLSDADRDALCKETALETSTLFKTHFNIFPKK